MFGYANPGRFLDLARWLTPLLGAVAALALAVGLYLSLFASPADYQQSQTVRIMYVHVPAAWMCMAVYAVMAIASLINLVWRHTLADIAAETAAPIGAVFTALALATGMLWGKPMWGTWWEWDARLTSVLVLLFVYLGYIALRASLDNRDRAERLGAVFALVGAVNLPIIKFSVDWWNTLHQPASVVRLDGSAIHSSMLWPLLVMGLAYGLIFGWLLMMRMQAAILRRRSEAQKARVARTADFIPAEAAG